MIHPKSRANPICLLALAATAMLGCSTVDAATYLYNVDCNDGNNNRNTPANTFSGAAILGKSGDI